MLVTVARQGQQWADPDAKDTKRIVERVWQLVRAGRSSEARDMCRSCGQSWRAASLGGGPTALGATAQQVFQSTLRVLQDRSRELMSHPEYNVSLHAKSYRRLATASVNTDRLDLDQSLLKLPAWAYFAG